MAACIGSLQIGQGILVLSYAIHHIVDRREINFKKVFKSPLVGVDKYLACRYHDGSMVSSDMEVSQMALDFSNPISRPVTIEQVIGFYMDSSGGGMDWFVMFVTNDKRVSHQHVVPQGAQAPLTLLSAFATDYLA